MRNRNSSLMVFGNEKPKDTKRNRLIKRAVKKAVKDYKDTFMRLANV